MALYVPEIKSQKPEVVICVLGFQEMFLYGVDIINVQIQFRIASLNQIEKFNLRIKDPFYQRILRRIVENFRRRWLRVKDLK